MSSVRLKLASPLFVPAPLCAHPFSLSVCFFVGACVCEAFREKMLLLNSNDFQHKLKFPDNFVQHYISMMIREGESVLIRTIKLCRITRFTEGILDTVSDCGVTFVFS